MAKTLDFNKLTRPHLRLVLCDDDQTEVKVTYPSEGLVEELENAGPEMMKRLEAQDKESIPVIYDLAARMISCNLSGLTVTAEELRSKYRLNLEMLLVFFNTYLEFINGLKNEKN